MKLAIGKRHGTMLERFNRFVMPVTESGCHLWVGSLTGGYGYIGDENGKKEEAHRFAYEQAKGPIPEGLQLDHLCRVRCCVNPDHLEPVTNKVNCLRGIGFVAVNARKTHCRKGHPYHGENLLLRPNGYRRCRTCDSLARAQQTIREASNRQHEQGVVA